MLKNEQSENAHFLTYQFMVYSWSIDMVRFTQVSKMLKKLFKSEHYCYIIDHTSGTVMYNMAILLQIKITFEKIENLEKKFT